MYLVSLCVWQQFLCIHPCMLLAATVSGRHDYTSSADEKKNLRNEGYLYRQFTFILFSRWIQSSKRSKCALQICDRLWTYILLGSTWYSTRTSMAGALESELQQAMNAIMKLTNIQEHKTPAPFLYRCYQVVLSRKIKSTRLVILKKDAYFYRHCSP